MTCSVTLGSLSESWQPASPSDSPVSPQFVVLSSPKIMDSLWVKNIAPHPLKTMRAALVRPITVLPGLSTGAGECLHPKAVL